MTLQSNDAAAALALANETLKALAVGEAMGDASMGEFFVTLAEQIGSHIRNFDDVGRMYQWRFEIMNAEKARRGRETTDMPSGNSLSAQLTKAKTIAQLGMYERNRTGTIAVLRAVAVVPGCAWKYKPLILAAGAIATTLDAEPQATDERLRDAAQEAIDNIETKTKTTEGELAKLVKALAKLREDETHGAVIRAAEQKRGDAYGDDADRALSLLMNAVKEIEAGDYVRKHRA